MPVRLSPLGPPGADAILVGDPRRAFALGQALTVQPEMSHLARGLWGYGGHTPGGTKLTVQATGVGGPSAVAVISDLVALGVTRVVRLGTCVAREPGIAAGSAYLIGEAIPRDGTSNALLGTRAAGKSRDEEPAADPDTGDAAFPNPEPDPALVSLLAGVAPVARVSSHDLVLRMERDDGVAPAPLRDLQTAATFAVADRLGIAAAAVLIVAEDSEGERIGESELEGGFAEVGLRVVRALEQN